MFNRRYGRRDVTRLGLLLSSAVIISLLSTEAVAQVRPPSGGKTVGDYTVHDFAAKFMVQQDDFAELEKYRLANVALKSVPKKVYRIVFLGDSITENWKSLSQVRLPNAEIVNRGISGQNSTQMLLRFENDVVDIEADAVIILAGTNDERAYAGQPADISANAYDRITRNVTAMSDIADARKIKVIICTLPPVGANEAVVARSNLAIQSINAWLKAFAAERGYAFADYNQVLSSSSLVMPEDLSPDGIHPNDLGYERMEAVILPLITALSAASRSGLRDPMQIRKKKR